MHLQQPELFTGQESFLAPTMRQSSSLKLRAGPWQTKAFGLSQHGGRKEKGHEDAKPHKEVPGALVIGLLESKILGEQQESPTVMTRSTVHLRVLFLSSKIWRD